MNPYDAKPISQTQHQENIQAKEKNRSSHTPCHDPPMQISVFVPQAILKHSHSITRIALSSEPYSIVEV